MIACSADGFANLHSLERATVVTILDNPALDECAMHAVVDPLVNNGWILSSHLEGLRACPAPLLRRRRLRALIGAAASAPYTLVLITRAAPGVGTI
jgi:hypothetical protein